ncbi:alpha/beta fold hydrolase [Roseovarius sp. SCSIO 43702]|uniref:alpha/beta fold hydrolase n=1 Tax=Roseovarius sp. SCSIO 43702 TaxID=2823043 RepID=UPI001C72B541|nr:alpha/beta fold hydrolase [Roseovarius sp. SCSIO 43702]QYX55980.1 alpha/beta fold hydrolase [Roseovarius sp. SCSIO 43702]
MGAQPDVTVATAHDLAGPEGAPAVVLIHGLGLSRAVTWDRIAPQLARDYRVLSYDLPGHGESAPPEGALDLAALGAQVTALMDAAGIARAALVGFSLGGMINRRVAMDHPDRVSGLAILNSPHERGEALQRKVEAQARASAEGGPAATLDAALARWFTEDFRDAEPERVARVREAVLACDPQGYAAARRVLAEGVTELIRPVPRLRHPALVMTCEDDIGSTPAMSWAIAGEMDEADVVILPGLRHLGLVERPDLFLAPLRGFLSRLA